MAVFLESSVAVTRKFNRLKKKKREKNNNKDHHYDHYILWG